MKPVVSRFVLSVHCQLSISRGIEMAVIFSMIYVQIRWPSSVFLSLYLRNTRSHIMAALSKFYSSSLVDAALSLSLHNRYGLCPHPAPPNNAGIVPV